MGTSRFFASALLMGGFFIGLADGLAVAQTGAPTANPSAAQTAAERYTFCAFYPQGAPCEKLYQQALTETAPPAQAVRQAYMGYARYLKTPAAGLTEQDRAFLAANGIRLPADFGAADLGGLHNVIADEALKDGESRRQAVNNFISRATEARILCYLNKACGEAEADKPAGA